MTVVSVPENALISEKNEKIIRIGNAVYKPGPRMLHIDSETQMLEPRIGDLLVCLAKANGPVSRETLLDDVWGEEGSDEALTQAISKLRRALNDTRRPHRIIQTVPKIGYRLGVAPRFENALTGAQASALQALPGKVRGWIAANRIFLLGFAAGAATAALVMMIHALLNPPVSIEREILCPEGADPADCSALID